MPSPNNKEKFLEAVSGLKELSRIYVNKQCASLLTSLILKTKTYSIKNITHPELIASFEMLANLAMSARELLADLPPSNIQKEDLEQLKKYHESIFHLLAQSENMLKSLNPNNKKEDISITLEEEEDQNPVNNKKEEITLLNNNNNLYKIISENDMNETISNFLKEKK
jgi:hypothetical protein